MPVICNGQAQMLAPFTDLMCSHLGVANLQLHETLMALFLNNKAATEKYGRAALVSFRIVGLKLQQGSR